MLRTLAILGVTATLASGATVEFNRDVRPILSDKCFTCHGPDAKAKGIRMRLDQEASAKADFGGIRPIIPGNSAASELIRRITSENKAKRMPPVFTHLTLSAGEIETLRRWIDEGAEWQGHWSYIVPTRPALPAVTQKDWVRNPIDAFVLARLEKQGMKPSPEARKESLIRRVTLDLTGLPPTAAEMDAFLNDSSANAYEKVVDRLLASPEYAEHIAFRWLDGARYADTNGYQTDGERQMWRWRDWVIDAFKRNMPFDQFTIEQIAGDQLPNPTRSQLIATGFNRNHRGNGEGGIVPEEYLVEYAVDRVETMSTVWLGSTIGCARCHSHKYDPFSQKEFYQLIAYFDKIPERGRYFKFGNTPPLIPAPTPGQQAMLDELDAKIKAADSKYRTALQESAKARADWEKSVSLAKLDWVPGEALVHQVADAGEFDGKRTANEGDIAPFGYFDKFTLAARITPLALTGAIITRAKDEDEGSGYGLYIRNGRLQANFAQRWLDDSLRVETERALEAGRTYHVAVTYDGSRMTSGIRIWVDGKSEKLKIIVDELNQEFATKEPLRIGAGNGLRFQGRISEVSIYGRALAPDEIAMLAGTGVREHTLHRAFIEKFGPEPLRAAWTGLLKLRREREKMVEGMPTVMIMRDAKEPKDTHLLIRGAYDKPGEKVSENVPAALGKLPAGIPNNRLALAKWLVSDSNPLTARVTVNRFWQMYFGMGLVKTVEDFGSQGEWPSHPDLLDWLAVEFRESGWNVKAMQKLIVMSATYRQSSKVSQDLVQRDPDNRLLARGPRLRLPAPVIRDQALAVSGLLVDQVGGPSVKPYQPAGLWKELTGGQDYKRDSGDKLYRRSLYTYWKRSSPPPSMANFDASARETCIVRESRTNTPLQALNLMNDVTYLEASRKLAERMMKEGGDSSARRIAYGFRLVTAREPRPAELEILSGAWRYHLDRYQTSTEAAAKLLTQGESPRDPSLNVSELAAYSLVANMIFNLDEAITKE